MNLHYIETSAMRGIGVNEAFEYIFEEAIVKSGYHGKMNY